MMSNFMIYGSICELWRTSVVVRGKDKWMRNKSLNIICWVVIIVPVSQSIVIMLNNNK